jgi:hypothetical protein
MLRVVQVHVNGETGEARVVGVVRGLGPDELLVSESCDHCGQRK